MLRAFARRTNLLVASRRFAILGSGPDAAALQDIILRIGGRQVGLTDPLDYLFWLDGDVDIAEVIAGIAPTADERPLIVIDARRRDGEDVAAAAGLAALDDLVGDPTEVRPGVVEYTHSGRPFCLVTTNEVVADAEAGTAAGAGADRIAWARRFMTVTRTLATELSETGAATGIRIGLSMVLEPKTAVLALLLRGAGAEVDVYAHSDETDDDVAEALRAEGLSVFASSAAGFDEQRELARQFLRRRPQILLDDGSNLIRLAHLETPDILERSAADGMIGAAEETTSGLRPLRVMHAENALHIPVIAVNDAQSKTSFDNLYGTGQSCVFAILDLLDGAPVATGAAAFDMSRARVAVAGFGPVGQGVARHCAALGAHVTISETDPVRALQAAFVGYDVTPLARAVVDADIVISATGIAATIGVDILERCAHDAVIAVAGGVPQEISIDAAVVAGASRETVARKVERFVFPQGHGVASSAVRILDDGGCINITAGEGNPIEIMDLSFGVQVEAVARLLNDGRALAPGIHPLSPDADARVAGAALAVTGLAVDTASAVQTESLASWRPVRFVSGLDS
ncbi:Adenosylhomocysteinase [Agreia sp. COWG]|nr:Adenosylhomocysteinase [Agreia sp. COWG]